MAMSDVILSRNITYVEVGSEIHLLCEADGLTPKDTVMSSTVVCGENGTWLPDLSELRCIIKKGRLVRQVMLKNCSILC